ncbi:nif-specific transcriptional activator NifA [Sulfidibacter corallicola]|uniref:Sigma 54-interacting transcriptional regulator n=1 Tax=Sulfidibacter corallicola TaxID=2818388 RepID=A0A8A4TTU0_SULCO|nr:sigma 54-interacting transcriptional regulator [Sulfidibacter corallicola]QTD52787.1 sigma 54-interacting transcriptional regulator [Sulfidibacter corallicola]
MNQPAVNSTQDPKLEQVMQSRVLDPNDYFESVVGPVLHIIGQFMGKSRVALSLPDPDTGELVMQTVYGLTVEQQKRGRYKIGEGITGKVFQTGEAVRILNVRDEPEFLDRVMGHGLEPVENKAFICVPIKMEKQVIGTLSAVCDIPDSKTLEEDERLLSIIASLVVQAVKLRDRALEDRKHLIEENLRLTEQLRDRYRPANLIGTSKVMSEVYQQIRQVSQSEATVMLLGESGVGKELVAHAIHYESNRANGPFIKVNCAALPESVLESELFGHERGAFTGAIKTRKGRFEQAHGGTLFLDEIGDFSPAIQVTLLRILQEKELERVGGDRTIKVDVRIIAATNRDLESLMEQGKFRQDLYYRLNVFPIHIPPLRERKTDIPLLCDHFIEKYNKINGKNIQRLSSSAIDMLMSYHWPGNVRELENCMERAVLLSQNDVIRTIDLPPTLQTADATHTKTEGTLETALQRMERELIMDALISTHGNMAKAAKILGLTERKMGLRVKRYNINPKNIRAKGYHTKM